MSVIPSGYAEVRYQFASDDGPDDLYCVFGITNNADKTPLAIAADALAAWDNANSLRARQCDAVNLVDVYVTANYGSGPIIGNVATNLSGTATGSSLPVNCAWLFQKQTVLGGRAGRGRMFLPGAQESNVDSAGIVAGSAVGANQDAATWFLAELNTRDIPMALLHNNASVSPTTVSALVASSKIGTQRRRIR